MKQRLWPPPRHDVPTLWERAKAMFAVLTDAITSAASLARRLRFGRKERCELVARLVPVEKLVRTLMMTETAALLLMTPEGRRLRTETPKIEPPAPPPPVGAAKPRHSTRIVMPGWRTLAASHPRIDPRVVEREKREALELRIAGLETLTQDPLDPQAWRCGFGVLHWVHDRDGEALPARTLLPKRRPRLIGFSDTIFRSSPA